MRKILPLSSISGVSPPSEVTSTVTLAASGNAGSGVLTRRRLWVPARPLMGPTRYRDRSKSWSTIQLESLSHGRPCIRPSSRPPPRRVSRELCVYTVLSSRDKSHRSRQPRLRRRARHPRNLRPELGAKQLEPLEGRGIIVRRRDRIHPSERVRRLARNGYSK